MKKITELDLTNRIISLRTKLLENDQPGSFTHHTEKDKPKRKRFQYASGPNPKEFGEPENIWNPKGVQPALNQDYMDWRASEQGKAHSAATAAHYKQQSELHKKHKAQHGSFDTELTIANPYFDLNAPGDDDDEPEEIDVGVNFRATQSGDYYPATWGYNGGDPEEFPDEEVEIHKVVDLDTGEDLTNIVDHEKIEQALRDNGDVQFDQYTTPAKRRRNREPDDYEESIAEMRRIAGLR
jgi:hypothetical protein